MKRGFSLVELSIVLVILGLLVGGVLSGRSLIRAAELRGIHTDGQRYIAAVYTFRDKYFQLPGDMNNATTFWGAAHATPTTCKNTVSTTAATCNGNGNGLIDQVTTTSFEGIRLWQHLANAGLVEGKYDGVNDVMKAKLSDSAWYTGYFGQFNGGTSEFSGFWGHDFELYDTAENTNLTPAEAWNVDLKADDGIPNTGKMWSHKGTAATPCTTMFDQATDTGALYNLSYSSNACFIYYVNVY